MAARYKALYHTYTALHNHISLQRRCDVAFENGAYVYDDVTYVYDNVTYVYDDVTSHITAAPPRCCV
jgi:hypothetical protein